MNNKKLAVCLLVLTAITSMVLVAPASAVGQGEWITKYTVEDADSGEKLLEVDFEEETETEYSPILAGAELKITFTINVFTSGEGNLQLRTNMKKATGE